MAGEFVLRTLAHVWAALAPARLPVAVMGGLALAVWKHVRATRDVDLLIEFNPADLPKLVATLRAAGLRAKHGATPTRLGELELVEFLYEPPDTFLDVQVDVLVAQSDYHHAALRRRIATRLPGSDLEISVLACEDLILHKLLAGRVIDRYDATALLRTNRPQLDVGYLLRWAEHLRVTGELGEVWQEACPGEVFPP
jgi:hypothetical protein